MTILLHGTVILQIPEHPSLGEGPLTSAKEGEKGLRFYRGKAAGFRGDAPPASLCCLWSCVQAQPILADSELY